MASVQNQAFRKSEAERDSCTVSKHWWLKRKELCGFFFGGGRRRSSSLRHGGCNGKKISKTLLQRRPLLCVLLKLTYLLTQTEHMPTCGLDASWSKINEFILHHLRELFSVSVNFSMKPKDIQFTIIEITENQQILTEEKLEL